MDRHPEAHLIGYQGQLLDQELDLEFRQFLRPIQKFESPQSLAKQIQKDISAATQLSQK
jgi:FAD synthase